MNAMANTHQPVLALRDLVIEIGTAAGALRPVDKVSFTVGRGEILGLVGESGSGKSMTGLAILGLLDAPLRIGGGSIGFLGRDLVGLDERELRRLRGNRLAMIPQNPMSALNPTMRIADQMIDAITTHAPIRRRAAWERARDALGRMGVPSPEERLACYPHELSGGMRQRVVIATALLNQPALIIADEPTTALDVTIQAQILHQVSRLCREEHTAMVWITHDLSVVAGLADRIAVMYAGQIAEIGTVDDVLDRPAHPYTSGLIRSVPANRTEGREFFQIPGGLPRLDGPPPGCRFQPRCERATAACGMPPPIRQVGTGRTVHCHHHIEGVADAATQDATP